MRHFGTTIKETISALKYRPHMGSNKKDAQKKRKAIVRVVLSIGLFIGSIVAIKFQNDYPTTGEVGKALIAVILGYWIK